MTMRYYAVFTGGAPDMGPPTFVPLALFKYRQEALDWIEEQKKQAGLKPNAGYEIRELGIVFQEALH